jgi:hypothetical protein
MTQDRTNPGQIRRAIGRKLHDLELQGIPAAACEIVLGRETETILMAHLDTMVLFTLDGRARAKGLGRMAGGKLDGVPVVVDSDTPHLFTARIRKNPCA